jgi:hypothetical protein
MPPESSDGSSNPAPADVATILDGADTLLELAPHVDGVGVVPRHGSGRSVAAWLAERLFSRPAIEGLLPLSTR